MGILGHSRSVARPPRGAERRRWVRHRIGLEACWRIRIVVQGQELFAHVQDISARGIGLVMEQPLAAGLEFTAEVTNTLSLVLSIHTARVIHVAELPGSDYLIGCQFETPLAPELLEAFLK